MSDLLSALLACWVSLSVLGDDGLTFASLLAFPLVILTSKLLGLYDQDELRIRKSTADEVPALFQAATTYALILWLAGDTFVEGSLSRIQVLGLWGILLVSMVAVNLIVSALLGHPGVRVRALVRDPTEGVAVRYFGKLAAAEYEKLTADTYASSYLAADERTTPVRFTIPASRLRAGTNTVAVELHLNSRSQPTAGFDLGLTAVS